MHDWETMCTCGLLRLAGIPGAGDGDRAFADGPVDRHLRVVTEGVVRVLKAWQDGGMARHLISVPSSSLAVQPLQTSKRQHADGRRHSF